MKNRMKAYVVRSKDDDQGSVLIFAEISIKIKNYWRKIKWNIFLEAGKMI